MAHDPVRPNLTDARPSVSPPRIPAVLVAGAHATIDDHDEWENERIEGGDLSAAHAQQLEITACELRGTRFTGVQLEHARLIDVVAVDCEFSGAMLTESVLRRVEFRNCRMAGLVISDSKLNHVTIRDGKLDGANFRFATGEHVVFEGCSMVEADFTNAAFASAVFSGCDLTRAVFTKASIAGTRLHGSTLDGLQGASALRGVVIGTDQVLPLALGVFSALGIVISDEPAPLPKPSSSPRVSRD